MVKEDIRIGMVFREKISGVLYIIGIVKNNPTLINLYYCSIWDISIKSFDEIYYEVTHPKEGWFDFEIYKCEVIE